MLKEFYLSFTSSDKDFRRIKHIQYNFVKRLNKLKYVTHRRIDILLKSKDTGGVQAAEIEWDDGRKARIICGFDNNTLENLGKKECIIEIYKGVLESLKICWLKNGWPENDLNTIYNNIEEGGFSVSVFYGKSLSSLDKKYKAEFYCEVFPDYTDYYFQLIDKTKRIKERIKFLKGITVIELFFGFYNNAYWRDNEHFFLCDLNKEIFYIFNVNSDSYTIEYKPVINSLEQCKNYVKAFQAGITPEESLRLLGLPN